MSTTCHLRRQPCMIVPPLLYNHRDLQKLLWTCCHCGHALLDCARNSSQGRTLPSSILMWPVMPELQETCRAQCNMPRNQQRPASEYSMRILQRSAALHPKMALTTVGLTGQRQCCRCCVRQHAPDWRMQIKFSILYTDMHCAALP